MDRACLLIGSSRLSTGNRRRPAKNGMIRLAALVSDTGAFWQLKLGFGSVPELGSARIGIGCRNPDRTSRAGLKCWFEHIALVGK